MFSTRPERESLLAAFSTCSGRFLREECANMGFQDFDEAELADFFRISLRSLSCSTECVWPSISPMPHCSATNRSRSRRKSPLAVRTVIWGQIRHSSCSTGQGWQPALSQGQSGSVEDGLGAVATGVRVGEYLSSTVGDETAEFKAFVGRVTCHAFTHPGQARPGQAGRGNSQSPQLVGEKALHSLPVVWIRWRPVDGARSTEVA